MDPRRWLRRPTERLRRERTPLAASAPPRGRAPGAGGRRTPSTSWPFETRPVAAPGDRRATRSSSTIAAAARHERQPRAGVRDRPAIHAAANEPSAMPATTTASAAENAHTGARAAARMRVQTIVHQRGKAETPSTAGGQPGGRQLTRTFGLVNRFRLPGGRLAFGATSRAVVAWSRSRRLSIRR